MKRRGTYLRIALLAIVALFAAASVVCGAMTVFLKDGRVINVPVNKEDILGISFDENPFGMSAATAAKDVPVTIYWHMADDADVYLNGVPLRRYEPSFKTRGDEAPQPAFMAQATLKNGDVFTVGGRRGGSFGLMLIASDQTGRVVFNTDQQNWRVYMPGERPDWFLPAVAAAAPKTPVTVQPDPWYPQKELNKRFGNIAQSVWGLPSDTFSYLTATVTLP
ncbi:MAG: hypothetical protein PHY31_10480 [Smithellaceae bacterium]|nr:hypothetical protein [Smithellaceae bacterium]